tara:strand:- start:820 stop:3186 length:2367 start_codon:yes stop_codon:yes gene_type:complete
MILRLILLFIAILYTEESVGSWKSFTSFHQIHSCQYNLNNQLYCLTNGGILKFDYINESNDYISANNGLSKSNFKDFLIDYQNLIWISNNQKDVKINLWDINQKKIIKQFDFDDIEVFKMDTYNSNLISIYKQNNQVGLLHFVFSEGEWYFNDFYNNIHESINDIYDIKIFENFILITSNAGVFRGYFVDNLKVSTNWENLYITNELSKITIGNYIQWFNTNTLYTYSDSTITEIQFDEIMNIEKIIYSDYTYIITKDDFFIYDFNQRLFHYTNQYSSDFIDIDEFEKKIYITIEKHGILEFNVDEMVLSSLFPIPSTMLNDELSAITIFDENKLVGVGRYGISYYDGYNWKNFIPNSIGLNYNSNIFNNFVIQYKLGNGGDGSIFPSWSIEESGLNTIIFGNTQIRPTEPEYAGALIELNIENNNVIVYDTTEQILDGMDGIYFSEWNNRNLLVNQIKKDSKGNLWVLNPYAESDSNIIAIKVKNSESWVHIKHPNDGAYFMPTELDFDSYGRVWVAFEDRVSLENVSYSNGGLKVLLIIGEIGDNFEYYWKDINNPQILPDNNVWSIAIDKQDFIWVLTSGGIQGYSTLYNDFTLNPIYLIDFYNYLPLYRGDHIRVDSQDNKWITTKHSGVKVILENTHYWPDAEGFTKENSGLLSNSVNDLAFDEQNGFIWFATDLGVSRLNYPIHLKYIENKSLLFHPNPYKIGKDTQLLIEGCFPNSIVMINDINGNHIITLKSQFLGEASSQVNWNGKNKNGNNINTGIYLVSSRDADGKVKRGKLAVIKQ